MKRMRRAGWLALAFGVLSVLRASVTTFPANGADNVPPDAPLRLTFTAAPTVAATGKIQILDTADQRVIDTIDLAAPNATQAIGGIANFNYHPAIASGNVVSLFPKHGALGYGRTYEVKLEAGAFGEAPAAWKFSTRKAPPAAGAMRLTIATDGTGDFCTVQGALDFVPDGNRTPITLLLRKGTYVEIVAFTNKHAITLLGEDRKESIITYANNARLNPQGSPYRRGMLLAFRCEDFVVSNLTLRNTTAAGGSQAEAIILAGSTTARAIVKDVDLYSFQDTLQINGQAYVTNCYIEGDVDFMWGTGPVFFESCIARSLRSRAYYTQIRNRATNHGYVYYKCTFDGAPGVAGNFLSRIAPGRFPNSEVVLIDCVMTEAVGAAAWMFENLPAGAPIPPAPDVHFWEFNSRDPAGKPVDVGGRMPGSRQLREPADAALIAEYRNPIFVLGSDWNPRAAPVFQARNVRLDGSR
jgi:pectin methylesterase-like acyl-CoA thioesterase